MTRLLPLVLLTSATLMAAVQGVITNATTGQRQAGVAVNLVQPGAAGMQTLGSTTTGADGTFQVDSNPAAGQPALIQATYRDVTYTQVVPPGTPTTGIQVRVFEATADPPPELDLRHLILLEPGVETLEVAETFYAINDGNLTYQDTRNGTLRFYLGEGVPGNLQMTVNATGVNVSRPVVQTQQAGLYRVDYPMRPGETRFDLRYSLPAAATFSGRVLRNDPPTQLVTPGTVLLSGTGIRDLGQEPTTGARVYTFDGTSYEVTIQGVGKLRETPESREETGAPVCCEEAPAQIHAQMSWVLGLGLAILGLGGALLFRKGSGQQA